MGTFEEDLNLCNICLPTLMCVEEAQDFADRFEVLMQLGELSNHSANPEQVPDHLLPKHASNS